MNANLMSRIYIIRKHQLPFFICVTGFFFLNVTISLDFYSIKQCMSNVTIAKKKKRKTKHFIKIEKFLCIIMI